MPATSCSCCAVRTWVSWSGTCWSPEDQERAYFLVGGLPQYLLCLDDSRSIDANIREHLLAEFAPLFHEPVFLLREELREIAPYQAVLHAVASGHGAAPAIATATGLPERSLHPNSRGATLGRRYFTRRKPAARRGANGWYSLEDLYALDAS